jgi:tRNA-dihydrouridine synthase
MTPDAIQSGLTLRGVRIAPALFLAPMAGVTHSAFRRLVADFGGHGALFTEMLLAKMLLREDFRRSSYLKRRPEEGPVFYQLLLSNADGLEPIIDRLVAEAAPAGIDVNCACPAPDIRSWQAGSALFENAAALRGILEAIRRRYTGILTIKIRLGTGAEGWEARLRERLALCEACGVDAVTLHPRFAGDKLKRICRHDLYAWAASLTRLPLIASGDISPETVAAKPDAFAPLGGIMVGRLATAQPWIFAQWGLPPEARGPAASPFGADSARAGYWEVWSRLVEYVVEDFPAEKQLGRVKIFTEYFSRNFLFGHTFFTSVRSAPDIATARVRAEAFLCSNPQTVREPGFSGI